MNGNSALPKDQPRRQIHGSRGQFGRLRRLCLKELRETLRDRRTIVTLVLMPLLVYPLLSMAFHRLLLSTDLPDNEISIVIGVRSDQDKALVVRYLTHGQALLQRRQSNESDAERTGADAVDANPKDEPLMLELESGPQVHLRVVPALKVALDEGDIDLAVEVNEDSDPDRDGPGRLRCELIYRENSNAGDLALDYVERRLRAVNEQYIERLFVDYLQDFGVRQNFPAKFESRSMAVPASIDSSLATLVPLVLILMTITGAVYPAIDLTAGERERGTLETLIAAPVPRLTLLVAKYVAVVTVAMITAMANLVAMTVTLVSSGLANQVFGPGVLTPLLLIQVLALLVLFAAFFSAVLLAVTSFARSFKEAQAYLIPLMMISLAPGFLSMIPGLEFSELWALTPLVNIVLLGRDMMQGGADPALAAISVASTAVYAVAALALATRVFGTDAVLYGSQAGWSDLFRRPADRRDAPTVGSALLLLAAMFPIFFVMSNVLARAGELSIQAQLASSAATTLVLFGLFPIVLALAQRLRLRSTFAFQTSNVLAFLFAGILGVSLWTTAHEIFLINELLGFKIKEEWLEQVQFYLQAWKTVSPLFLITALAVVPAICEELCFRGYLFSALQRKLNPVPAIIVSALLFGLFHVATSSLAVERMLPSTFLGLMLGWVCWRTGSIFPGMILHVSHNSLLLLLLYYQEDLERMGFGVDDGRHLPLSWIAGGVICAGAASAMLYLVTLRDTTQPHPKDS